jgi:hypothetical protein
VRNEVVVRDVERTTGDKFPSSTERVVLGDTVEAAEATPSSLHVSETALPVGSTVTESTIR